MVRAQIGDTIIGVYKYMINGHPADLNGGRKGEES